jgi:hypothetical protein
MCHAEMRNACIIPIVKSEGKKPLARSRRRQEYNSKIYLKYIGYEGVDCYILLRTRVSSGLS